MPAHDDATLGFVRPGAHPRPHGRYLGTAKSPHGGGPNLAKSPHGLQNGTVGVPDAGARTPVVLLDERPPQERGLPAGSRRPVVAMIDAPIAPHPWLGDGTGDDPFWRSARQDPEPWNGPALTVTSYDPEESYHGHGTFVTGIVRQIAPEARVLALPVMNDRGEIEVADVLSALGWVLERVRRARNDHRPGLFVDVVNLSFGWHGEITEQEFQFDEHQRLLAELGAEGVQVVAAVGNRGSDVPIYPAAFATELDPQRTPLLSVGALDPDGADADYSDHGDWVTAWAPGTGVISTAPRITDVAWSAPSPNPNHQARGFARWSGTSFAAAWVSATIAEYLLFGPDGQRLDELGHEEVRARAARAAAATQTASEQWKAASRATG